MGVIRQAIRQARKQRKTNDQHRHGSRGRQSWRAKPRNSQNQVRDAQRETEKTATEVDAVRCCNRSANLPTWPLTWPTRSMLISARASARYPPDSSRRSRQASNCRARGTPRHAISSSNRSSAVSSLSAFRRRRFGSRPATGGHDRRGSRAVSARRLAIWPASEMSRRSPIAGDWAVSRVASAARAACGALMG